MVKAAGEKLPKCSAKRRKYLPKRFNAEGFTSTQAGRRQEVAEIDVTARPSEMAVDVDRDSLQRMLLSAVVFRALNLAEPLPV